MVVVPMAYTNSISEAVSVLLSVRQGHHNPFGPGRDDVRRYRGPGGS